MHSLAATAGCHSGGASALDDFCNYLQDHTGSTLLVNVVGRLLWPLCVLLLLVAGLRVVRGLVRRTMRRSHADSQVQTLVNNALVLAGYAVALGGAFVAAGLEIGVVLTLGGATSIVVGLAMQDLLRNVIAGTLILIERPFRIGDVVTIDTVTGTVQTIALRTTTLRLPNGQQAIIPNLTTFTNRVVNITAHDRRQFTVGLWVALDLDLEAVIRAARAELDAVAELAPDPPPRVQPDVQIDGGVTLNCEYWLDYRDHDADAIAAALVRRLAAIVEAVRAGRTPDPPPARTVAATAEVSAPPVPRAGRRVLRGGRPRTHP